MKRFLHDKENRILIPVIIVTLVIASLPLFTGYCLTGHDSEYHLLRIEALKEGIVSGVPFLKINLLFFGGAGYASSMFYPDFLLYIPAVLRALNISINASWHLYIFICIALCFASAFFSSFFMTKNKYAALISGILFTLCSYHIDDIYVRAAAGEFTAFIFLPVFLYGLYNICYEKMSKPQLMVISLAGILLCHTLSFLLCIIITVVIILFNFKSLLEDKKIILKLVISALVTIGLTAYYLFPMLEQLLTDKFYVSDSWIAPAQEAVQLTKAFELLFPTLGAGLFLFILPRIIIKNDRSDKLLKFADECIIIGLVLAALSTDLFPWESLGRYLSIIQFPWRLFQLSSALLAMAGTIVMYKLGVYAANILAGSLKEECADKCEYSSRILSVITVTVLAVMTLTVSYSYTKQDRVYYDFSDDYYSYKPFTAGVIAGEWLPKRVTDMNRLVEQSEHAYSEHGNDIEFSRIKGSVRVCPKGEITGEYIDVPLIYYKGYAAKTDSGKMLRVDGSADNGLTRVYINGSQDNFTVYYKGTMVQHISLIISIVTLVCIAAVFIYRKRFKNTEI